MNEVKNIIVDYAYAIITGNNLILPYTIRSLRKDCISDYEDLSGMPFEDIRSDGKRCVKVKISTNIKPTT